MKVKQSRAARAKSTRSRLLSHARQLFAEKGYADASTDDLVRRAAVTKGALYHHYANKLDLYRAVVEDMEREVVAKVEAAASAQSEPRGRLRALCHAYLDACLDANLAHTLVIEAPVVLGWKGWCDIAQEYEVATFARHLNEAVAAGFVRAQPLESTAQVLLGALNTAARVVSTAAEPAAARLQVEETIERLLVGLESSDISAPA